MRIFRLFVFAFLLPSIAHAENFPPLAWDDPIVAQIVAEAREDRLPKAKLHDGTLVGQESAAEKAVPLLPTDFAKKVVNHSVFWNTVKWCGLSMKKIDFSEFEDKQKWNDKQRAFIAVLHGTTTSLVQEQLRGRGDCTMEFRSFLVKNYPDTAN